MEAIELAAADERKREEMEVLEAMTPLRRAQSLAHEVYNSNAAQVREQGKDSNAPRLVRDNRSPARRLLVFHIFMICVGGKDPKDNQRRSLLEVGMPRGWKACI